MYKKMRNKEGNGRKAGKTNNIFNLICDEVGFSLEKITILSSEGQGSVVSF